MVERKTFVRLSGVSIEVHARRIGERRAQVSGRGQAHLVHCLQRGSVNWQDAVRHVGQVGAISHPLLHSVEVCGTPHHDFILCDWHGMVVIKA